MTILERKVLKDWSDSISLLAVADQLEEQGKNARAAVYRALGEGRAWLHWDPRNWVRPEERFDCVMPGIHVLADFRFRKDIWHIGAEAFSGDEKREELSLAVRDYCRTMNRHAPATVASFRTPGAAIDWLERLARQGLFNRGERDGRGEAA